MATKPNKTKTDSLPCGVSRSYRRNLSLLTSLCRGGLPAFCWPKLTGLSAGDNKKTWPIKITKKRLTKTDLRVNLKLSKFDSDKHTIYPDIFIFINFGC